MWPAKLFRSTFEVINPTEQAVSKAKTECCDIPVICAAVSARKELKHSQVFGLISVLG
jgi:hypothetical protein